MSPMIIVLDTATNRDPNSTSVTADINIPAIKCLSLSVIVFLACPVNVEDNFITAGYTCKGNFKFSYNATER